MKEKVKYSIYAIILTAVLLVTSGLFVAFVIKSNLLVWYYILACGTILFVISAFVFWLSFDIRKKIRSIIAGVLVVITILLQCFGIYYIQLGLDALNKITDVGTEHAEICIYVRSDDSALLLTDAKDYLFGILELQDREATDKVLLEIAQELGAEVNTKAYSGVEELVNALLDTKEVNAIIINKSFLDLLDESEEHEGDIDKLREIHIVLSESEIEALKPVKNENIFTVYISGIDCRGKVSRRSRSDVNIIATVNMETGHILLVNTPRDYYVPLSTTNGIPDKLTHAGIYGVNVSKDTLSMLYDIEIDYYFRLNFDGFEDIVDALGGITVNSGIAFKSHDIQFVKGENTLNGKEALIFARTRKAFAEGVRRRGKNHMEVIKGVINKITSPAILLNYTDVLKSIEGTFETNMPSEKLTKIIQNQISNGTNWNVAMYSVDGRGDMKKPYSLSFKAYVMVPDQATVDKAKDLMQRVRDGEIVEP